MEMKVLIICVLFSLFTMTWCFKGTMVPVKKHKACDTKPDYDGHVTGVSVSSSLDADGDIVLKEGTNVSVSFFFKLDKGPVTKATSVVHGIIAGVPVPFPLTNSNACENSGLKCPLAAGNSYTYNATVSVPKIPQKIRLAIKWAVMDQSSKTVWCQEMPALVEK